MKSLQHLVPTGLTLLLACSAASAQTVYRCGNSYSQTPCANGVVVPVDDARSDEQRAAARQGLAQDKHLALKMETARHKEEAMDAARIKAAQTPQAHNGAHPKSEDAKPRESKTRKKAASLRTVKVQTQEPGTFTVQVDSGVPKKSKSKAKTQTSPSTP